ncbi:MAG: OB-fold nucleic acid binding domain-containing protein [Candidatus Aenigmatarchaeota archaeon]
MAIDRQRLTAKKAPLSEIVHGRFVQKSGFESNYVLSRLGRRLSRVMVLGLVVDKFLSEDGNYATITLDDGTETMRCKVFVNTKMFDRINPGDLVSVMGKVREYNGEIYIVPESVRKEEANMETLRMLELKRQEDEQKRKVKAVFELKEQTADLNELKAVALKQGISNEDAESILEAQELIEAESEKKSEENSRAKEAVLKIIEEKDMGNGADYGEILRKSGLPESLVDATIQDLLESGVCFEPKAGRIKKI